jgi:hypothetical protein
MERRQVESRSGGDSRRGAQGDATARTDQEQDGSKTGTAPRPAPRTEGASVAEKRKGTPLAERRSEARLARPCRPAALCPWSRP